MSRFGQVVRLVLERPRFSSDSMNLVSFYCSKQVVYLAANCERQLLEALCLQVQMGIQWESAVTTFSTSLLQSATVSTKTELGYCSVLLPGSHGCSRFRVLRWCCWSRSFWRWSGGFFCGFCQRASESSLEAWHQRTFWHPLTRLRNYTTWHRYEIMT